MSMQDYAYSDYGLLLNEEAEKAMKSKSDFEDFGELAEADECDVCFGFTGESIPLTDDGEPLWGAGETYMDDDIYYVGCDRQPRIVGVAYQSVDEIVEEMRAKMNGLLPDTFDYRGNLRFIVGTYYG